MSPVRDERRVIRFLRSARATTDFFVTDAPDSDDYIPDDDFFPDIDNPFDDMAGEDTNPKTGASAPVPYVLVLFLFELLLQFLALVSALHKFDSSSYMQMIFTFSLSDSMTFFISAILFMFSSISVNKIIW